MRALVIEEGFGLDNLHVRERPDPTPGPGQVVLAMKAASLNYRDHLTVMGMYGRGLKAPLVPFSDGAGVIEAVGPGVTRFKPGDRAASLFFSDTWLAGPATAQKASGALGGPRDGCGQEKLLISEQGLSPFPEHLDFEEAACLPCAGLTAWRALVVDAQVKAGDVVLLQGTGGVSIFALQFAHAMGCETIITSSSDEKLARCKALGATHVINYRTEPNWGDAAKALTGGRGVDCVIEVGGANTLTQSLRAVKIGGHVAIIGLVGGLGDGGAALVPTLIGSSARLQGLFVGSRENFEDMCRAIALHKIKPVFDKRFAFTEARRAFETMQAGSHFGKIVLTF